jgi:hypothetical protein
VIRLRRAHPRAAAILTVALVIAAGALVQAASARASTIVPLWSAVHRDASINPTAAQLAPFNNVGGWNFQRPRGYKGTWWDYAKGTRTNEASLPESWYIHVDGGRVRDKAHTRLFVMNPLSLGWRDHVAPQCALRCYLDGLGDAARKRTVPSITSQWSGAEWREAVAAELAFIVKWGGTVLPNSSFGVLATREYSQAAGRTSTEGFSGLQDVPILKAGHVWVFGKTTQPRGCRRLLAAYLIGKGRGDHFSCFNLSQEPWDVPSDLEGPRIGKPLAAAQRLAQGWKRRFRHGTVIARDDGTYRIRFS